MRCAALVLIGLLLVAGCQPTAEKPHDWSAEILDLRTRLNEHDLRFKELLKINQDTVKQAEEMSSKVQEMSSKVQDMKSAFTEFNKALRASQGSGS